MKTKRRTSLTLAALASALLMTLSGCASLEEVEDLPYSVVVDKESGLASDYIFHYIGFEGEQLEMPICDTPFFSAAYCETEDGRVRF